MGGATTGTGPARGAPPDRARLARFFAAATGAEEVVIAELAMVPGGAVQESWRVAARFAGGALAGEQLLLLRRDAPTALGLGLGRGAEFAVQRAAFRAGIATPEPLFCGNDPVLLGAPFFVMRWAPGASSGSRIVAGELGGPRDVLLARLARELALTHSIAPPRDDLACLGAPPIDAAQAAIAESAPLLAGDAEPHPVAEWGLRWLIGHAPPPVAPVLCHGDFRTGNYLADGEGFTALLDWEFAHWGDPAEDLGWFCLGSWRFGAYRREAGGIAGRKDFHRAYEQATGQAVDAARAHWWEVMAALRWLLIALKQRDRCLVGGERSLDLALTGRRPAECEAEILRLISDDVAAA